MLFLASNMAFAQMAKVELALDYMKHGKLDSSKANIDAAVLADETKNEIQAWLVRGVIYKELYKAREATYHTSSYRDEAAKSLLKAHDLDAHDIQHTQTKQINQQINFIASKYFNDAGKTMDTLHYKQSIANFEKYIQLQKAIDPNFDPKQKELEFCLALITPFQDAFEDKKNEWEYIMATPAKKKEFSVYFDMGESYLQKALDIDPRSKSANKNLGLLYYNRGVNLIMNCPVDIGLDTFITIEAKAEEYFSTARPYMLKAHAVEVTDQTVIQCLMFIYVKLYNKEKVRFYAKLYELEVRKSKEDKTQAEKYKHLSETEATEYYIKLVAEVIKELKAEDQKKNLSIDDKVYQKLSEDVIKDFKGALNKLKAAEQQEKKDK